MDEVKLEPRVVTGAAVEELFAYGEPTIHRSMQPFGERAGRARVQRAIDELASLERELDQAWPDPRQLRVELERVEREIAALQGSLRVLEGPRRFVDLVLAGVSVAALAFCLLVACLVAGAP